MAYITIRVLDGADRGREFTRLHTPVTIGREEGNSVQLNDERISRFHLKIQEDQNKLVLTDLDSTNGTKVNGDDVQLRIVRSGDVISLGRSVLLLGSRDEIAQRLAEIRKSDPQQPARSDAEPVSPSSLDYELYWPDMAEAEWAHRPLEPPELPERLSPGQAAQLSELLEYMHFRIRDLIAGAQHIEGEERIGLDERHWQALIDLQSRVAEYLRKVAEPRDD